MGTTEATEATEATEGVMENIEALLTMCRSNDHEEALDTVSELFDSLSYETLSNEERCKYEYLENYFSEVSASFSQ